MFRTPNFKGGFPSLSTIADKKEIRVKYFFENYIYAKFHENRWFDIYI